MAGESIKSLTRNRALTNMMECRDASDNGCTVAEDISRAPRSMRQRPGSR